MARGSFTACVALALGLALTGCSGDMDPATWFPDGKKKLPGERRELFPEGVPGVTQGVPPELIRGNPAHQTAVDAAAPQAQPPSPQAAEPQAEETPKVEEKPKARPRPKTVRKPTALPPDDAAPQRAAQQPASGAAWPSPQPQAAQPQQQQQAAPAGSGWPAPPPAGTFTR
jgi:hypothetical protein